MNGNTTCFTSSFTDSTVEILSGETTVAVTSTSGWQRDYKSSLPSIFGATIIAVFLADGERQLPHDG